MLDTTRILLSTAATEKARDLCTKAFETLRQGRRTFSKGQAVYVPWGDGKVAELRRLQVTWFEDGPMVGIEAVVAELLQPVLAAEGLTPKTPAAEQQAFLEQAVAIYRTAGISEVHRLFNAHAQGGGQGS